MFYKEVKITLKNIESYNKYKIRHYLSLFIIFIFIVYFNSGLDFNISFYGDNSTKFFQAFSLIENHFKDDIIRCKWMSEFDYCKYFPKSNTMVYVDEYTLKGVFPIALSYLNALFIRWFNYNFFIILPQIIFFLFLLIIKKYLNPFFILMLFFSTQLFFTSFIYTDFALSLFFTSFFFVFFYNFKKSNLAIIFILGFIAGLNVFYRYEGEIFLVILITILFLFDKENRKQYLIFGSGLSLSLLLFFITNYIYYNNFLGIRLIANKEGIFTTDLTIKMLSIWGNIWGNSLHPVGFFKYKFYLLIFYILFFYYRDKMSNQNKYIYYSILTSLIILILLVPNDSGVDYGTRYLAILLVPSFILLNNFFKLINNKFIKFILVFFMIFSIYYTYQYYKSIIKINIVTKKLYESIEQEFRKNSLWIFHSNYLPFMFGSYLLENKILVIEHPKELEEFKNIFEQKKIKNLYKNVVVFNYNSYNLDMFLKSDLKEKDRSFYEDDKVREKLINYIKLYYANHITKSISYNNYEIIIHQFN